MSITIHLPPDLEHQLNVTSAAQGIPAENIIVGAVADSLGRFQPLESRATLSAEESRLLAEINRGLPEGIWVRYHALKSKAREETISDAEHEEFLALIDQIENAHARRLTHVAELAHLRNVSLDEMMGQLGLFKPSHD